MVRLLPPLLALAVLAGCDTLPDFRGGDRPAPDIAAPPPEPPTEPMLAPESVTEEALDTTTEEDRREAAAAAARPGESVLGTVVASLGDPAAEGFWLETPLVTETRTGRVRDRVSGTWARVELRPASSNRISLPAMRLLGLSLTDLPELEVYAG